MSTRQKVTQILREIKVGFGKIVWMKICVLGVFISFILLFEPLFGVNSGQVVPEYVKKIVDKTEALGIRRYPIGFWNYNFLWIKSNFDAMNEEAVKEWAEAGITVAQGPRFRFDEKREVERMHELLNWCEKYKIKIIIPDSRTSFPTDVHNGTATWADYEKRAKEAIAEFGSHPAMFGFTVGDEPHANTKNTFFETVHRLKNLAPNLHPFANLLPYWEGMEKVAGANSWSEYLDEYAKKANPDFICYDCYRQMENSEKGIDIYFNNLRLYREAMIRNGIPFWTTLLCVGHYHYRHPTRDELRWQFHTAIAFGAKGIMWFFWYHPYPEANYYNSPYDDFFKKTQTYYDLYDIHNRFQRRYGKVINNLVSTRVTFAGTKPLGGCKEFTPNGLVAKVEGSPTLVGEFVDPEGKRYVMLVNLKMKGSSRIQVTFSGKDAKYFSYRWSDGSEFEGPSEISLGARKTPLGPMIDHYFYPAQMVLYRVESKSARNEKIPEGK